jgi:hypothetical protein
VDDDGVGLDERDGAQGGDLVVDALHRLERGQAGRGDDRGRQTGAVQDALQVRRGAVPVEQLGLLDALDAEDHPVLDRYDWNAGASWNISSVTLATFAIFVTLSCRRARVRSSCGLVPFSARSRSSPGTRTR